MTAINHSPSPPQPEGECFPWHSMKTTWPLFKEGAASSPTLWRIREDRPDATVPTIAGHKRQETAPITRWLQNIMPCNTLADPTMLNMQLIFEWRIMFHMSRTAASFQIRVSRQEEQGFDFYTLCLWTLTCGPSLKLAARQQQPYIIGRRLKREVFA